MILHVVFFVAGAVVAVVSSKAYAFVKKQVTSVETDATAAVQSVEKKL